jgi:hypothetical protein
MKQQGKRRDQLKFSEGMIGLGVLGISVMLVLAMLGWGNNVDRNITLDDYLDGTELHVLDTINSIDSIGYGYTDEDLLWIGADGDTFRD